MATSPALQRPASPQNPVALSVRDLGVTLGGKTLLEGVTFDLRSGSTLAIVGPNGGGKSTLFRALMNLVPHSGKVEFRGRPRLGLVPQGLVSTDVPITVREFLALKSRADFESCVASVGLRADILTQRLDSLSGGELQRVLIGWAIVDRPDILLFDEPTSGVDIGAEEPIYNNLDHLKTELGITSLLISHNMHVVMHYSDYVLALNRRPLYFGETRGTSHERLIELIYGERFSLQESEHHGE